ncbi:hypothetical protein NDA01_17070 [Trichocoleus desertorum AS-A10]|uniref:hypothetical protein n=1 Tax=Trichocoleus desertorum TaxID=1481672 RepID=UPI0032989495
MGKLTNSLKATTKQLSEIKRGIHKMQELGQELADNTLTVAEAGLRTGYAYAKAELETTSAQTNQVLSEPHQALPSTFTPLDAHQLENSTYWTIELLKSRFGSYQAATKHLKDVHGVSVKQRGWQHVVAAFNKGVDNRDKLLEQRVAQLEEVVSLQRREIAVLEARLDETVVQLKKLTATVKQFVKP